MEIPILASFTITSDSPIIKKEVYPLTIKDIPFLIELSLTEDSSIVIIATDTIKDISYKAIITPESAKQYSAYSKFTALSTCYFDIIHYAVEGNTEMTLEAKLHDSFVRLNITWTIPNNLKLVLKHAFYLMLQKVNVPDTERLDNALVKWQKEYSQLDNKLEIYKIRLEEMITKERFEELIIDFLKEAIVQMAIIVRDTETRFKTDLDKIAEEFKSYKKEQEVTKQMNYGYNWMLDQDEYSTQQIDIIIEETRNKIKQIIDFEQLQEQMDILNNLAKEIKNKIKQMLEEDHIKKQLDTMIEEAKDQLKKAVDIDQLQKQISDMKATLKKADQMIEQSLLPKIKELDEKLANIKTIPPANNIVAISCYTYRDNRKFSNPTITIIYDKKSPSSYLMVQANLCIWGKADENLCQCWKYEGKVKTTTTYGQTNGGGSNFVNNDFGNNITCQCIISGHTETGVQVLTLSFPDGIPFRIINPNKNQHKNFGECQTCSIIRIEELV